jgi:transposase InsO family protein
MKPASNALLTRDEVAEISGMSESTIKRQDDALQPAEGPVGRNGKPVPLYDVAALPADVQAKWAGTEQRKVVEIAPAEGGQLALALTVPVGPNLSDEDRAEATWRFGVIEALVNREKFPMLHAQYPQTKDLLPVLAAMHSRPGRAITTRTIYRWLLAWQKGGLPALVRKDRADKGLPKRLTDAARDLLLSVAMPRRGAYGALRVKEMWRVYEEERAWRAAHAGRAMNDFEQDKYAQYLDAENRLTAGAQLPQISYETFRVWFNRIPDMVKDLARSGNEAYRNRQEIISHRDIAAVEPMDYVVMDHRRLDVFCLVKAPLPHGRGSQDGVCGWKLARPWLTAAIDMRTRKWLAWAIVETPSSDSIATCLKRVFIDYGLPKSLYWDNGKDFICEWFEGRRRQQRTAGRVGELDDAWRGVLGTLGIRVHHAIIRNARAKLIEPNFNRVSNFDRQLPEWCGHKPGARTESFNELVKEHERWAKGERQTTPFRTIEQIASLYNAAMRSLNETALEGDGMRKVTATGRGWMCPNEAWELLIPRVPRRDVPLEVLHMCFAKRKELTVHNGEVSTTLAGQVYRYRMADHSLRLMQLNGRTVDLAYDPLDMGEAAIYYEDRFFGLARCIELRRMGEQAFVQDEKDRRGARREIRKAIEAIHRLAPVPTPEERLARRAEVEPDRDGSRRVTVPAEIAGPVAEAADAAAAEKDFSFAAAPVVEKDERPAPEGDDDFSFFSK